MPLKLKLSLVITVVLAVTVVLLSAMLLRQQQRTLTAEMVKRGLTIAQNLAPTAKARGERDPVQLRIAALLEPVDE